MKQFDRNVKQCTVVSEVGNMSKIDGIELDHEKDLKASYLGLLFTILYTVYLVYVSFF